MLSYDGGVRVLKTRCISASSISAGGGRIGQQGAGSDELFSFKALAKSSVATQQTRRLRGMQPVGTPMRTERRCAVATGARKKRERPAHLLGILRTKLLSSIRTPLSSLSRSQDGPTDGLGGCWLRSRQDWPGLGGTGSVWKYIGAQVVMSAFSTF